MSIDPPELTELRAGLETLGIPVGEEAIGLLLDYDRLLQRWNRVYNLTRVLEDRSTAYHLLDSLAVQPFLEGDSLIDVGSGGGQPGIPLAICNPGLAVTLLDSNGKKVRFLEQARISLGLRNVRVAHSRVEDFEGSFAMVTCRAFAPLPEICKLTAHLLAPGGKILAMKGAVETAEVERSYGELLFQCSHNLAVPGIQGRRQLIVMEKR